MKRKLQIKPKIAVSALLIALFSILLCISPDVSRKGASQRSRALGELRSAYRAAEVVASGECVSAFFSDSGEERRIIKLNEIVAGSASAGDELCLATDSMTVGESYLVYLSALDDAYNAGDTPVYSLLTKSALKLSDGKVKTGTASISYQELILDIKSLMSVVAAPSELYYYHDIASLTGSCDAIFIGNVTRMSDYDSMQFRSEDNGTSVQNTLSAAKADVEVYGAIKGGMKYGEKVTLIISPDMGGSMIDAQTLKTVGGSKGSIPQLMLNRTYVFFALRGPDVKQLYYYPVNPVQGYVRLKGEELWVNDSNELLANYYALTPLVNDIKRVMA